MNRFVSLKCTVLIAAVMLVPMTASAEESTRISGVGLFDEFDVCNSGDVGAHFALILTGDLEGCLYVFAETAEYTPSGTYVETGWELFVDADGLGTFETEYKFEAKYEDPSILLNEIFGRCQHKIVENSGTGIFEGVSGRIDFKDDIEAGDFPYSGSLQFPD